MLYIFSAVIGALCLHNGNCKRTKKEGRQSVLLQIGIICICPAGRGRKFGGFLVRLRIRACRNYNKNYRRYYKKIPKCQRMLRGRERKFGGKIAQAIIVRQLRTHGRAEVTIFLNLQVLGHKSSLNIQFCGWSCSGIAPGFVP